MAELIGGRRFEVTLRDIVDRATNATSVKVGFMAGATYPDGKSVPLIAAINEFGAPSRGQPPRPFFRRMIAAKEHEWPPAVANLLRANGYDAQVTLQQTGAAIEGQLTESIRDLVDPPLSPVTVAKKGFDKPLIDTGVLFRSVTFLVE